MDTIHVDWAGEQSRHLAAKLLDLRRERIPHLLPVDGSGPAWDLMLALMAGGSGEHPCVAELADGAGVPRTTTFRWLRELDKHGFVSLSRDRRDRRVVRVKLTESGEQAMEAIFAAAGLKAPWPSAGDAAAALR